MLTRRIIIDYKRCLPSNIRKRTQSASAFNLLPNALRDAIKDEVINDITKPPESHLPANNCYKSKSNMRNSLHNQELNDNYGIKQILSQKEIDSPLSPIGEDPLVEWYLDRSPVNMNSSRVSPLTTLTDPFKLSAQDNALLSESIRTNLITANHPVLNKAASHFFSPTATPGKMIRPAMIFLLSQALNSEILPAQRRLAEIAEMIHTASLFHDDVIDESDVRRGNPTVHRVFGNKVAILAGDFLLARASRSLARLRNVVVIEAMTLIIDHLVQGEVMQFKHLSRAEFDEGVRKDNANHYDMKQESRMEYYLRKNFYKTGSLMAQSCMSTAILGGCSPETVDACYRYGKHLGLAFQLVDDVLDFEGSLEILGKPPLNDLKSGLATAPVLFAMENNQHQAELEVMMERKFRGENDVERVCELVENGNGIELTKNLARVHTDLAIDAVMEMPITDGFENYRDALVHLANNVVNRTR